VDGDWHVDDDRSGADAGNGDDAWKRNVDPRRDDASTGRDAQALLPLRRDGRGG
jgi:hypothetical protein